MGFFANIWNKTKSLFKRDTTKKFVKTTVNNLVTIVNEEQSMLSKLEKDEQNLKALEKTYSAVLNIKKAQHPELYPDVSTDKVKDVLENLNVYNIYPGTVVYLQFNNMFPGNIPEEFLADIHTLEDASEKVLIQADLIAAQYGLTDVVAAKKEEMKAKQDEWYEKVKAKYLKD